MESPTTAPMIYQSTYNVVKAFQDFITLPNSIPDFSRGKINLELSLTTSMQHVGFRH